MLSSIALPAFPAVSAGNDTTAELGITIQLNGQGGQCCQLCTQARWVKIMLHPKSYGLAVSTTQYYLTNEETNLAVKITDKLYLPCFP
jgi:hypothetical protein